jgi:pantothenate kinase
MREFIHFITLNRRTKNRLLSCLESLHSLNEIDQESYQLIHDQIAIKKVSQAIKGLIKLAADSMHSDNSHEFFWDRFHQVVVDHKMLELQMEIRSVMKSRAVGQNRVRK